MRLHPKINEPLPDVVEYDADEADRGRLLETEREQSGGLSDDPEDDPVVDSHPFVRLRSK